VFIADNSHTTLAEQQLEDLSIRENWLTFNVNGRNKILIILYLFTYLLTY